MRAAALLLLFELALAQQWTASTAQEPEPEPATPEETDEQKAARFEASCGDGEIARALGIHTVIVPHNAGVLSAVGIGLSSRRAERVTPIELLSHSGDTRLGHTTKRSVHSSRTRKLIAVSYWAARGSISSTGPIPLLSPGGPLGLPSLWLALTSVRINCTRAAFAVAFAWACAGAADAR